MRLIQSIFLSLLSLNIAGCAQMFTAKTNVRYVWISPDGARLEAEYSSDKDQSGFTANLKPDGTASVTTDKANTPEAVMRATAESLARMTDMLNQLMIVAAKFFVPPAPIPMPQSTVPGQPTPQVPRPVVP